MSNKDLKPFSDNSGQFTKFLGEPTGREGGFIVTFTSEEDTSDGATILTDNLSVVLSIVPLSVLEKADLKALLIASARDEKSIILSPADARRLGIMLVTNASYLEAKRRGELNETEES